MKAIDIWDPFVVSSLEPMFRLLTQASCLQNANLSPRNSLSFLAPQKHYNKIGL